MRHLKTLKQAHEWLFVRSQSIFPSDITFISKRWCVLVREANAFGEKISDITSEASRLTFLDDLEHAVISLKDGRRVLVSGGRHGVELTDDVNRVLGHTHPWTLPPTGPSGADLNALEALGQRSSYLLERGELNKFSR